MFYGATGNSPSTILQDNYMMYVVHFIKLVIKVMFLAISHRQVSIERRNQFNKICICRICPYEMHLILISGNKNTAAVCNNDSLLRAVFFSYF